MEYRLLQMWRKTHSNSEKDFGALFVWSEIAKCVEVFMPATINTEKICDTNSSKKNLK